MDLKLVKNPKHPMFRPLTEIVKKEFPPLQFLIRDIITEVGTTLFAGPPKIGKSAFLLQIIGKVAKEGQRVFYFAGEDGDRRLKERVIKLGISPDHVICHAGREHPINRENYMETLEDYLKLNPDIKAVILDTMELAIVPKQKRQYEDWVADLQPWNDLAHTFQLQVIMVHHCKKGESVGIESILGSQGIAASFETLLVMQRDQGNVHLHVTGKDVPENTIVLEKLDFGYKLGEKTDPKLMRLGATQKSVYKTIKEKNDKTQSELINIMTTNGFRTENNQPIGKVQMSNCISNLLEEGLIA